MRQCAKSLQTLSILDIVGYFSAIRWVNWNYVFENHLRHEPSISAVAINSTKRPRLSHLLSGVHLITRYQVCAHSKRSLPTLVHSYNITLRQPSQCSPPSGRSWSPSPLRVQPCCHRGSHQTTELSICKRTAQNALTKLSS